MLVIEHYSFLMTYSSNRSLFQSLLLISISLSQAQASTSLNLTLPAAVTYVGADLYGDYWVCFSNPKKFTRYAWNFTQIYERIVHFVPVKHELMVANISVTLSNGSSYEMFDIDSVIFQEDRHQARLYDYSTPTYKAALNLGTGNIELDSFTESFPFGAVSNSYRIGAVETAYKLRYDGVLYDVSPALSTTYIAASFISVTYTNSGDALQNNYVFLCSTVSHEIYRVNINLNLLLNHGAGAFDYMSHTTSYTLMGSSVTPMTSFLKAGNIVLVQDSSASSCFLYDIASDTLTSGPHPTGRFVESISHTSNNDYYLTHADSLDKYTYDSTSKQLEETQLTKKFTGGSRSLSIGSNSTVWYQNGSNTIEVVYLGIDEQLTYDPPPPSDSFLPNWGGLLEMLNSIYSAAASVPGGRRFISPLFKFFSVFDDMHLYQFHDRLYGDTMNAVFAQISDVEEAKWSIIDYKAILGVFGFNVTKYQEATEYQTSYNTYNFTTANHTDVGPEGLMVNSHNFFIAALPLTFLGFILGRILFKLTFNYRVSTFLRKFDFLPFFLILLFDGNVLQFSFYLSSELQNLFSFGWSQKAVKVLVLLFGFLLIFGSTSLYFVCYSFYGKLNRLLMDNNINSLSGQWLLMVEIGLKNVVFGMLHSILRRLLPYQDVLVIIISIETIFFLIFLASIRHKMHHQSLKMWIYVVLSLIKIFIISTFFLDYGKINNVNIQAAQQVLIITQLSCFLVGVIVETIDCLRQLVHRFASMLGRLLSHFNQPNEHKSSNRQDRQIFEPQSAQQGLKYDHKKLRQTSGKNKKKQRHLLAKDREIFINTKKRHSPQLSSQLCYNTKALLHGNNPTKEKVKINNENQNKVLVGLKTKVQRPIQ